jgi:dTDP-4-dehydrorhamnose 3,5-epimerase
VDESRILIIGANGQLGKALQARWPKAQTAGRDTLDITDEAMVQHYDWSTADVIVNAAVFANVDGAETSEGRVAAWRANATGVGNLARAAAEHNLTLVHVSSDYVFDGTKRPHTETEDFSPLNVYGQSKAAGDIAAATVPKHYIARTTWLIGEGGNFVRTMIGLAGKNISPTVVSDQIGRLTFTNTLVDAIDHLLQTTAPYGTYNVTNGGESVSWADITRAIFKELGRDDLTVTNTTTQEYFASKPGVAPRPLQSEMDLSKLTAADFTPEDWHQALHDYIGAEQGKANG